MYRRMKGEVVQTVATLEALRFVGIDWAAEEHAVCVLDETAERR